VPEHFDDSGMASAYGQLLGLLVESPNIDAILEKVVHLAGEVVTPAAACGVTVRRDGQPFSAAVNNRDAAPASSSTSFPDLAKSAGIRRYALAPLSTYRQNGCPAGSSITRTESCG